MGEIMLAAKIAHAPSILISERPAPLYGKRAGAISALREIGKRARDRGADLRQRRGKPRVRRGLRAGRRQVGPQGRRAGSGSMSHQLVANNRAGDNQWELMGSEFNRQIALRVLNLWHERCYAEFVRMLPD